MNRYTKDEKAIFKQLCNQENKRILKKKLLLYFGVLFMMIVSLYTSQVILDVLRDEGFRIANVLCGVVFLLYQDSISRCTTCECNIIVNRHNITTLMINTRKCAYSME